MRSQFVVAVHLLFFQNDSVLLLLRANTGWKDGFYSVPAGHVENGQSVIASAIREAKEETGVDIKPSDLEVVHVMHRKSGDERVDFFLTVRKWHGQITNNEPHKCDDLSWFPINSFPENIIPYVEQAISNAKRGILYSEFGWDLN